MTNKEKANELAQKYKTPCHGVGDCEFEVYQAMLEAMRWKEEQFRKEVLDYIELAYSNGEAANLLEDLLKEI